MLRLEDGRLVRAELELGEREEMPKDICSFCGAYPWMIAGEWQDILFEDVFCSG